MTTVDSEAPPQPPPAIPVAVTSRKGSWRGVFKWATGVTLTFVLGTLLLSLTAAQLTAAGTAHKALRRTVASLTEIDGLLAQENPPLVAANGDEATATQVRIYPPGETHSALVAASGVSVCSSPNTPSYSSAIVAPVTASPV